MPMLKSWISTQNQPLNLCSRGDGHWVKCKRELFGLSSPLAYPLSERWQERHPCLFKEQNFYLKEWYHIVIKFIKVKEITGMCVWWTVSRFVMSHQSFQQRKQELDDNFIPQEQPRASVTQSSPGLSREWTNHFTISHTQPVPEIKERNKKGSHGMCTCKWYSNCFLLT